MKIALVLEPKTRLEMLRQLTLALFRIDHYADADIVNVQQVSENCFFLYNNPFLMNPNIRCVLSETRL